MAAPHAAGAPGIAERGHGEDDRDRDRHRLWLLGIGPLCCRLPVTIRRSALGRTASPLRRLKTGGNRRAGMEICTCLACYPARSARPPWNRWFADSLPEGTGFEPSVPGDDIPIWTFGTDG